MAAGIKEANEHPDAVARLMVGNEVLLRGDLTPDRVDRLYPQARKPSNQPVSTAEVWSFVLRLTPRSPRARLYLDPHSAVLDDVPVSIDLAEQHLIDIVRQTHQAFPGKPLLIAETCWPSIGRDRGPAPSMWFMRPDYIRRVPLLAARLDYDYNILEAFDQP